MNTHTYIHCSDITYRKTQKPTRKRKYTIYRPLVQKLYDWTVRDANILFTGCGVLSLAAFVGLRAAANRIADRSLLLLSFLLAAAGYALLSDRSLLSPSRFLCGFALLSVAFPIGRASCVSLYTKLLRPAQQQRGQGVLLAVGALARIIGPFPAALSLRSAQPPVFATTAAAFLCAAAAIFTVFRQLKT